MIKSRSMRHKGHVERLREIRIIIVVVFQRLGLLACSGSEFIFWNFRIHWTVCRTPWTGDRPNSKTLPTQVNTTQKNADTHPCLEWDLNPRSQRSSGRRQYMPQTVRSSGTGGEIRNAYKILVGKSGWKRPLGRRRRKWGIVLELILGK
jgi:hypothetical protein